MSTAPRPNNWQVIFKTHDGLDYCREPYKPYSNARLAEISGKTDDLAGATKWANEQMAMNSRYVGSFVIENWA